MKAMVAAWFCAIALCRASAANGFDVSRYDGVCDASAAVALDHDHFVVADDEHNLLVIYKRGQPTPVGNVPLDDFLGTEPGKESDLEGSAVIENRIYWIASHGRNAEGKVREERYRLFAADIETSTMPPSLKLIGTPYRKLIDDLLSANTLKNFHLDDAASRAPEAPGGLNIEGLAATPDGKLLIGFRNPIIDGKALVVPLDNPQQVIAGQSAKLGSPFSLDLGGRGIRSMERVDSTYLIVAGPPANSGTFALFKWSGGATEMPRQVRKVVFTGLTPEALFEIPMTNSVQILSDDGDVKTNGKACKKRDADHRSFRSITVTKP
jgi:hypothetical protein